MLCHSSRRPLLVPLEVEREELDYLIEENPWIPSVVADASKHRIYAHRGQSVLVEFAAEGSIVITCVVSALALWILNKTLGETIKEAWLTSPLHHHLKEFLSRDRIPRTQQIAQRLKPRIRGLRRLEELPLSVTVEVSEARGISRITVTVVTPSETQLPPKRSDFYPATRN